MANYLQRVALRMALRVVGAVTPSQQVTTALNQLFAMSIGDRHPATLEQQLANKSWVFAANRQIGGRAVRAQPVLELVQRQNAKMPKRTAVYDHPFLKLLDQPNLDQTGTVFQWQQILQLNTAGRCYVLVEPTLINLDAHPALQQAFSGRRVLSNISRLTLLEPDRVRPFSALGRRAAAFEYFDLYGGHGIYPAAPATYAQREEWRKNPQPFVVRIFIPSPDSWNGQSVTEAADWAINTSFGLNQMWQNQLKNGLHAGLIFYLKKRGMSELERFEKAVAVVKAGIGKAGEPLILPDETVSVERSPLNMADMQYENLGAYSRQEILAVLGASDSTIGLSGASNRANADTMERQLALGTIDPLNGLISDAYNSYLLPLYPGQSESTWYEIRYGSAAASDEVVQTQVLTAQAGGPIITPNEARAELDKPPVEGGDTLRGADSSGGGGGGGSDLLSMMFGAGPDGEPPKPGQKQLPSGHDKGGSGGSGNLPSLAGQHEKDKATQPSAMPQLQRMVDQSVDAATTRMVDGVARALETAVAELSKRMIAPAPAVPAKDDCGCANRSRRPMRRVRNVRPDHPLASLATDANARRAKLKALDVERAKMERAFRKAIGPVFVKWSNAMATALSGRTARAIDESTIQDALDAADVTDIATWAAELSTAYGPWARATARDIAMRVLRDYGISNADIATLTDSVLKNLEEFVLRRADDFATQVAGTQVNILNDAIETAVIDGVDSGEVVSSLADTFPVGDDPRLRDIARTETTITTGTTVFAAADGIAQQMRQIAVDLADDDTAPDVSPESGFGTTDMRGDVGLMWLSMRDDKVRETHRQADGQVVALGDEFELAGCNARYPGDDETCDDPSEICNCRCDAVVVPLEHDEGWGGTDPKWKNGSPP